MIDKNTITFDVNSLHNAEKHHLFTVEVGIINNRVQLSFN